MGILISMGVAWISHGWMHHGRFQRSPKVPWKSHGSPRHSHTIPTESLRKELPWHSGGILPWQHTVIKCMYCTQYPMELACHFHGALWCFHEPSMRLPSSHVTSMGPHGASPRLQSSHGSHMGVPLDCHGKQIWDSHGVRGSSSEFHGGSMRLPVHLQGAFMQLLRDPHGITTVFAWDVKSP